MYALTLGLGLGLGLVTTLTPRVGNHPRVRVRVRVRVRFRVRVRVSKTYLTYALTRSLSRQPYPPRLTRALTDPLAANPTLRALPEP